MENKDIKQSKELTNEQLEHATGGEDKWNPGMFTTPNQEPDGFVPEYEENNTGTGNLDGSSLKR